MVSHGSLFTGVGGFDLALESVGVSSAWQVELDGHANRVLERHWPEVHRYPDVRDVAGGQLVPVDIITGGFPCQDLSVAGARAGLAGERSGLFHQFARIIGEMRDATAAALPRAVVIENVPGLFSSHRGADFGVLLDSLAELGAVDIQWGVLDARWWLPQRRRRVYIVARFDAGAHGQPEVLPVGAGRGGHLGPSHPSQPDAAPGAGGGARDRRRFDGADDDAVMALSTGLGSGGPDAAHAQAGWIVPEQVDQAITAKWAKGSSGPSGYEHYNLAVGFHPKQDPISLADGMAVFAKTARARNNEDAEGWREAGDEAPTLNVFDNTGEVRATVLAVAEPAWVGHARGRDDGTGHEWHEGEATALRAGDGGSSRGVLTASERTGVRRLTPRECERLQGFPDDWTALDRLGRPIPDTARYRLMGNAVAVPCAAYVARHLTRALT